MKVLVGPANSGKTTRVIALLADALVQRQSRPLLVVPSDRAAGEMKARLYKALVGRRVHQPKEIVSTFPALYRTILNHTNHHVDWIKEVERHRLLHNVVTDLKDEGKLEYFDTIATKPGLVAAVASFIDELWRSGTSPEEFALIAESRNKKDRDIARIFSSYAAALNEARSTESEGAGLLALTALDGIRVAAVKAGDRNGALPYTLVAADGFNFYTAVQVRLLSTLAALGAEVVATITYEEGRAIHIWQQPTRARLAAHATATLACRTEPESSIELAAMDFMRDEESLPDSEPREKKVVETDSDTPPISIISAPDRLTEVREVAREINRLIVEEKFAVDDVAVVCRSLQAYAPHLERVFNEWSLALHCDRSPSLAENPLIIGLLNLIGLSEKRFPRRVCLDCLRSPYFDFAFAGMEPGSIDMLDRLSIKENLIRGREQWREAIIAAGERGDRRDDPDRIDKESPADRKERYANLCTCIEKVFDALAFAPAAARRDYAKAITDSVEKLNVRTKLTETPLCARDRVALDTFFDMLTTISESRHNRPGEVRWADFLLEIESAVRSTTYKLVSQGGPAVLAQEVHDLRPRRFRAVFILGMVEGEFPIRATERSPYTLNEREELRRAGVDLTETPADAGADLAQFYRAMSLATDKLCLSFPRTDLAGGELLPSYLIDEVKLIARTRELRIAPAYSSGERRLTKDTASLQELASATAARMRESSAMQSGFLFSPDPEIDEAALFLNSNLASWPNTIRAAAIERRRLEGRADRFAGIFEDNHLINKLDEMFGPNHMWYASQINDYGICPFRFFARHVIGLIPMDQAAEGFVASQLGTAYHRILEDVYFRLTEKGIQVSPEMIEIVREIVEDAGEAALEKMVERREIRKNALWEFEKTDIKKRIAKLLERESSWNADSPAKPAHFERPFGKEGEPPLRIKNGAEEIQVCGVIDRIDERDDGCVVIDYKTGRTPIHYNEALDGRNLQLPIYMMAAARVVAPERRVAGAYYLHINSRKRGSELPHRDNPDLTIDNLIEHAEKCIRDYAKGARKGRFPVRPNRGRCPNYCEFEIMCRINSTNSSSTDETRKGPLEGQP